MVSDSLVLARNGATSFTLAARTGRVWVTSQSGDTSSNIPERIEIDVSDGGVIKIVSRAAWSAGDVMGKIVQVTESRKQGLLYFVERNIWSLDLSSYKVTKVASVSVPANSQTLSSFADADGTGNVFLAGYTMCSYGGILGESSSSSSSSCVRLHDAPGAPLVEYNVYSVSLATGSIVKSAATHGAEWLVRWPGFDASATATPGMRLQSISGPPSTVAYTMFDFASFTEGQKGADTTSRFFQGHRISFSTVANYSQNRCAYLISVSNNSTEIDLGRIAQWTLPSEAELKLAVNGPPPAPRLAYEINMPATAFVGAEDNFSGWIASDWSFLYAAVNHTIYRYVVTC